MFLQMVNTRFINYYKIFLFSGIRNESQQGSRKSPINHTIISSESQNVGSSMEKNSTSIECLDAGFHPVVLKVIV